MLSIANISTRCNWSRKSSAAGMIIYCAMYNVSLTVSLYSYHSMHNIMALLVTTGKERIVSQQEVIIMLTAQM